MITVDYAISVATHLQNEGKLEQAKLILNTILDAHPTHAYALHLSGIIAYQTNKATLGVQLIQQAIENNSTVALFHSNLGEIYRQLKKLGLSIQCGQRAIALDPHSAIALSNLGIAYYDAKQYEQAENYHKRALALHPTLSYSLNNLGSIYKAYGNMQQAIAFYQAAIAASPQFVEPLNNLGTLYLQQQEFKPAYHCLNQAITLMPTFADAHCNMGLVLLGLDQYSEALVHFEKALQIKPHYAEAYYGMAKVHLRQQNNTESEHYIQKAIAVNPQQVDFYALLAEIYQEQGKNTQALMYLDHALSIDATRSSLYISKGNVLMEMGEISSAEEQFLKVTQDSSAETRMLAHYCLVQLRKIEPNNSNLKALLSIVDAISEVPPSKQPYIYFALGKCYDDMGAWTKAFSYFTQGCALKRKHVTYHIAEQIKLTYSIIHHFSKETIAYLRTFANSSTLPIFIVGMPRSGTTLVEQMIAHHPKVYGAGELKYLNNIIQSAFAYPENMMSLSSATYHAITDKYLACLAHISSDAIRVTDKMPSNFIFIGLIHALFPHAKIIHVKRNPIDTCLSCYTKLFNKGQYYSYDLTELGQYYHCYEIIMNHWRNILPSNAWLDINYEDIIHQQEVEAKRLIAYCDLTWDPACLAFYESKRNVRTASFMQVRQPIYTSSVDRWRRFENELAPLIKTLSHPLPNNMHDQIRV